ncbi:hypothetical protein [uncultured Maribacter sp.]|uniref:hypothetical protein n=1 Tax=uncultured Maribacter sp. TaxID=431308 RepID=UPI00262345D6|nr:hypothetical protein [uncultured Maribacter sp.]
MYSTILVLHSIIRWLVLTFLLYSIYRVYIGYTYKKNYSKTDNSFRHWTATIAHIQLMLGMILYFQSPVVKSFWSNTKTSILNFDAVFYGLIHMALMFIAIIVLTIGSALAKRKLTDKEKFKTTLVWFCVALFIILIAIPWPFSPLASRPIYRVF